MKKLTLSAVMLFLVATVCFAAEGNFLADRHVNDYGMECGDCHAENPPAKDVGTAKCFECHESYEALSEVTQALDPDPHTNHMIFPDSDCSECHKGHKNPALMCDSCHMLDLDIR